MKLTGKEAMRMEQVRTALKNGMSKEEVELKYGLIV